MAVSGKGATGMAVEPYSVVMDSPAGRLGIRLQEGRVTGLDYLARRTALQPPTSPFARGVARALQAWFQDAAHRLDMPVALTGGTEFQLRVWAALQGIPQGETRTYGELASQLGSGARAVGNACRSNPLPILVPCHRVIAVSGPGGYAGQVGGAVLQGKLWLLRHEGVSPAALKSAPAAII